MSETPDTPELKALAAFLAASFDSKLDGAKMREAMIWTLGRTPSSPATEPDDRGEREQFEESLDNVRTQVFDTLKDWHKINVTGYGKDHRRLWGYMRNVEGFLGCLARGDYDAARALAAPTAPAPTEPVSAPTAEPVAYWFQKHNCFGQLVWDIAFSAPRDATQVVPLYATPPTAAAQPEAVGALPTVCDGKEQEAFEAFCVLEKLNLSIHPIHYLFLDPKTDAARQAWKAALQYVGNVLAAAPTPEPMSARQQADWRSFIEGMEVSVDVSTDEASAEHRYFGTVSEVMDHPEAKHGVILLVQNPEPNFAPLDLAPQQPEPMSAPTAEPVGWQRFDDISNQWTECSYFVAHGFTSDVPLPGFRAVYATPPSAATPEPIDAERLDAARWRAFIGLDYALRAEWATNLSLAPILTKWVDNSIAAMTETKGGK